MPTKKSIVSKVKKPARAASTTKNTVKKPVQIIKPVAGESKAERAMKIMEAVWKDIQAGKIQRKDVIKRFIDEVGLTKAGAATYYGNIKKKLEKPK